MKNTPTSFADLLTQLAGGRNKRPALATSLGYGYWQVFYWQKHNKIPEKAWDSIIELAKSKGRPEINLGMMRKLARKSEEEANARRA